MESMEPLGEIEWLSPPTIVKNGERIGAEIRSSVSKILVAGAIPAITIVKY